MSIEDILYPFLGYYQRFPKWVRILSGKLYRSVPLSLRYGKLYDYYNNLIAQTQYYDDNAKNVFILENLKSTFINAYENTDFYKTLFNKIKFDPYSFDDFEKVKSIPFSDKMTLRENKSQIKNKTIPESKLLYTTSGGTSGIPIEVYFIKGRERTREYVFMTNQWKRIGYEFSDRIAVLRGVVVDHNKNNTLFKYEPIKNRLLLSNYDLYESNYKLYIDKLKEFKPHFIHTYPSAVIVLAKYIINENIKFEGLKGVFCSSEQIYPGQREIIEKAFDTRVFSWYGHTEGTTLAGECEMCNDYHIYFEYGYTELVDEDGNVITEPGKIGEIVGTSFEMKGFPVIRYRTGDYAEFTGEKCKCGRNYTLIRNVQGRWKQEQIITYKNSGISLTSLNMHSDLFDNVLQYQFHQKLKGEVVLKVIKKAGFTKKDEMKINKEFQQKFKDLVDFKIEYVDNISRTAIGKHKFLIQEIKE